MQKRRGRPPLKRTLKAILSLGVTDDMFNEIQAFAQSEKISAADFCREAIERGVQRKTKADRLEFRRPRRGTINSKITVRLSEKSMQELEDLADKQEIDVPDLVRFILELSLVYYRRKRDESCAN